MSAPGSKPRPISTENCSLFCTNALWSTVDCVVEIAAVLIDRDAERVLLVYDDESGQYTLPRVKQDDFEALLQAPLENIERKIGVQCTPLPLPKLAKKTLLPPDGDWRKATAMELYSTTQTTTNPFHVSIGSYWITPADSKWPEGYQLITYWYAGAITENLAGQQWAGPSQQPGYRLESFQKALEMLEPKQKGEGKDMLACTALTQFVRIWTNAKRLANGSTDLI